MPNQKKACAEKIASEYMRRFQKQRRNLDQRRRVQEMAERNDPKAQEEIRRRELRKSVLLLPTFEVMTHNPTPEFERYLLTNKFVIPLFGEFKILNVRTTKRPGSKPFAQYFIEGYLPKVRLGGRINIETLKEMVRTHIRRDLLEKFGPGFITVTDTGGLPF